MPQAVVDGHKETLEGGAESARMILKAGGRLGMGGDYGFAWNPHGDYAKELTFFVKHVGFTPLETITCATKTGAEIMGRAQSSARSSRASWPTSWSSTATCWRTSRSWKTARGRGDAGRRDQGGAAGGGIEIDAYKAPLADYLSDGLEELRKQKIDANRMPLKKARVRK